MFTGNHSEPILKIVVIVTGRSVRQSKNGRVTTCLPASRAHDTKTLGYTWIRIKYMGSRIRSIQESCPLKGLCWVSRYLQVIQSMPRSELLYSMIVIAIIPKTMQPAMPLPLNPQSAHHKPPYPPHQPSFHSYPFSPTPQ